jgi:hypothetical protein
MINSIAQDAIDSVVDAKRKFVSTFVQNEKLAEVFNTFVEVQAAYTKEATKLSLSTLTDFSRLMMTPSFYAELMKVK